MEIRIAVMGYKTMADLFRKMKLPPDLVGKASLTVYDALFEEAAKIAIRLESEDAVDVFLSGSGNASFIRPHLHTPVVNISISAFDLMSAIRKASEHGGPVAVISFREPVEGLADVLDVLKPEVLLVTYDGYEDLWNKMAGLKRQGCRSVVGASLVCEIAGYHGLESAIVYSSESLRLAVRHAYEVGESRRAERVRAERFRTIINHAYGGIMATDSRGVIVEFNPAAERIMGVSAKKVLGKRASDVIPNSRMDEVLASGQAELNQLQDLGDIRIITNRVPIVYGQQIEGVVATFQDVGYIETATEAIRRSQYRKGFRARVQFKDIVNGSPRMGEVLDRAARFARSDLAVLISGESGVGKELIAQSVHNESPRRAGPFVAVNCAALTESLLESELFGYEEGSFTGARRGGKEGLFELAHRGTIFLDEIGEITPPLQARLLRVLQEKEILRVGGTRIIPVDVRVVASTNKNLWQLVQEGRFRDDLYYRLNVLSLNIPPLRERPEDICPLVKSFLSKSSDVSSSLLEAKNLEAICEGLWSYDWPGNVRELENFIDRLVVLLEGRAPCPSTLRRQVEELIHASLAERHSGAGLAVGPGAQSSRDGRDGRNGVDGLASGNAANGVEHEIRRLRERQVLEALRRAGGNKSQAARDLGISRSTLWRWLKDFGIR